MSHLKVKKLPHHEQDKLCETRPAYRQGRKLTAVKVYTINNESKHLIVAGVPKLQLRDQLKRLFSPYGDIKKIYALEDYPCKPFEESFHVHYARIQSARIAKKFVDGKNFYGGLLHVFYAPELETLVECREKLAQRRKDVFTRIERHKQDPTNPLLDPFKPVPIELQDRKKKHPARVTSTNQDFYSNLIDEDLNLSSKTMPQEGQITGTRAESCYQFPWLPYNPNEPILHSASQETKVNSNNSQKRKNYKGQTIDRKMAQSKIFKPQLYDTLALFNKNSKDTKIVTKNNFMNVKKVDNKITIKIPAMEDRVKRIVMKSRDSTQLVKPSDDLQISIQSAKGQIREAMLNQMKTVDKDCINVKNK